MKFILYHRKTVKHTLPTNTKLAQSSSIYIKSRHTSELGGAVSHVSKQTKTNKQTLFHQLKYIEKHHPTWMTISNLKNYMFNYKRVAANAKIIAILFVCVSFTMTHIYNTFSLFHILVIVAQCAEQTQFGIILNTNGYRTH